MARARSQPVPHQTNDSMLDDRESPVYGLNDSGKFKLNAAMVWVPMAIGVSVAAGMLTTRGLQRIFTKSSGFGTNTSSSAKTTV